MAAVTTNHDDIQKPLDDLTLLEEKNVTATTEETSRATSTMSITDDKGSSTAEKPSQGPSMPNTTESTHENTKEVPAVDTKSSPAVQTTPETTAAPVVSGPVKVPFPYSLPENKPAAHPALTPEQTKKYEDLLATVSSWTEIPTKSARNAPKEPITADERLWLTRECLLRYLRATKWSPTEAPKRLLATLTWRREYGLSTFTPDYISPENETGKQVILGFDNDARPCLYLNPSKQNTPKSERQLHHLVFMLERAIEVMGPGQETVALLINFKETSTQGNPSVKQGRDTLNILQGHYPERLGRALISDLPWYVTTFFRLISPFIDPVTKSKMKFNEDLTLHVPSEQLQAHYSGKVDFQYDHAVYWPAINELCETRRKEYRARWEKAGSKIGEHEEYLRGGEKECVAGGVKGTDLPRGSMDAVQRQVQEEVSGAL